MESSLFNTVRVGFNTVRYAEIHTEKNQKNGLQNDIVGHISLGVSQLSLGLAKFMKNSRRVAFSKILVGILRSL